MKNSLGIVKKGAGVLALVFAMPAMSATSASPHESVDTAPSAGQVHKVSHSLAGKHSYSVKPSYKWGQPSAEASAPAAWANTKPEASSYKWATASNKVNDEGSRVVAESSGHTWGVQNFADQSAYKWGIRSHTDQAAYKWGIRSYADQAAYKWGIRSHTDQAAYKWGIRGYADQAAYKWGIRSHTDQAAYKWGIRGYADQAAYKWGIRSYTDQAAYKWGIR